MDLIEALNWRYAVRKFTGEKIGSQELKILLEAVRLSPSSYGLQPYKIVVVESKAIREQLLPFSYGQDKVVQSSHLIIFAAQTYIGDVTVDRYINKHASVTNKTQNELAKFAAHIKSALADKSLQQQQEWAQQQAYIALGNMLTSAALMKIDCCPMAGFDRAGYDAVLKLNEKGLTATVICPIGRRHQDDMQASASKVRFNYDEIVMEY